MRRIEDRQGRRNSLSCDQLTLEYNIPPLSLSFVSWFDNMYMKQMLQTIFLIVFSVIWHWNIILTERDGGEEEKNEAEDEKKLTLQELREKNAELRLVCEELTRELASALQERINLRAKLLLLTWCDYYSLSFIHSKLRGIMYLQIIVNTCI